MHTTIPHLAIPFRFANHGAGYPTAVVNEQDSEEEILDCVETVLRYQQGDRPERPEFGLPDLTFYEVTQINPNDIEETIAEWEPRIRIEATIGVDKLDPLITRILVEKRRAE